jgi:hypothetical protein
MDDYGLSVEVCREPRHELVTVAGEMDIAAVRQLHDWLAAFAAGGRPLIVIDRGSVLSRRYFPILARSLQVATRWFHR